MLSRDSRKAARELLAMSSSSSDESDQESASNPSDDLPGKSNMGWHFASSKHVSGVAEHRVDQSNARMLQPNGGDAINSTKSHSDMECISVTTSPDESANHYVPSWRLPDTPPHPTESIISVLERQNFQSNDQTLGEEGQDSYLHSTARFLESTQVPPLYQQELEQDSTLDTAKLDGYSQMLPTQIPVNLLPTVPEELSVDDSGLMSGDCSMNSPCIPNASSTSHLDVPIASTVSSSNAEFPNSLSVKYDCSKMHNASPETFNNNSSIKMTMGELQEDFGVEPIVGKQNGVTLNHRRRHLADASVLAVPTMHTLASQVSFPSENAATQTMNAHETTGKSREQIRIATSFKDDLVNPSCFADTMKFASTTFARAMEATQMVNSIKIICNQVHALQSSWQSEEETTTNPKVVALLSAIDGISCALRRAVANRKCSPSFRNECEKDVSKFVQQNLKQTIEKSFLNAVEMSECEERYSRTGTVASQLGSSSEDDNHGLRNNQIHRWWAIRRHKSTEKVRRRSAQRTEDTAIHLPRADRRQLRLKCALSFWKSVYFKNKCSTSGELTPFAVHKSTQVYPEHGFASKRVNKMVQCSSAFFSTSIHPKTCATQTVPMIPNNIQISPQSLCAIGCQASVPSSDASTATCPGLEAETRKDTSQSNSPFRYRPIIRGMRMSAIAWAACRNLDMAARWGGRFGKVVGDDWHCISRRVHSQSNCNLSNVPSTEHGRCENDIMMFATAAAVLAKRTVDRHPESESTHAVLNESRSTERMCQFPEHEDIELKDSSRSIFSPTRGCSFTRIGQSFSHRWAMQVACKAMAKSGTNRISALVNVLEHTLSHVCIVGFVGGGADFELDDLQNVQTGDVTNGTVESKIANLHGQRNIDPDLIAFSLRTAAAFLSWKSVIIKKRFQKVNSMALRWNSLKSHLMAWRDELKDSSVVQRFIERENFYRLKKCIGPWTRHSRQSAALKRANVLVTVRTSRKLCRTLLHAWSGAVWLRWKGRSLTQLKSAVILKRTLSIWRATSAALKTTTEPHRVGGGWVVCSPLAVLRSLMILQINQNMSAKSCGSGNGEDERIVELSAKEVLTILGHETVSEPEQLSSSASKPGIASTHGPWLPPFVSSGKAAPFQNMAKSASASFAAAGSPHSKGFQGKAKTGVVSYKSISPTTLKAVSHASSGRFKLGSATISAKESSSLSNAGSQTVCDEKKEIIALVDTCVLTHLLRKPYVRQWVRRRHILRKVVHQQSRLKNCKVLKDSTFLPDNFQSSSDEDAETNENLLLSKQKHRTPFSPLLVHELS